MKDNIGGPPPTIGTVLCNGYKCHEGQFRSGPVLAVAAPQNVGYRWAALVQAGGDLHIVTDIDLHVGAWRSIDRADEHPTMTDAAQKRQRAAWHVAEQTPATPSATNGGAS